MASENKRLRPVAILLTVLAALARIWPHPPNFTPVGSAALFGGARLRGWQAYVVPVLAMVATDPIRSWIEGGYPAYSWGSLVVYGCFFISVVLGRLFLRGSTSPARIAIVSLVSSVQFFLITNFAVWLGPFYPHTVAGIMACYTAAIPFFAYTVAGDLFYCGVLFGAYAWMKHYAARSEQGALAA